MRRLSLLDRRTPVLLSLLVVLAGCCSAPLPYVTVPEAKFRTELTKEERLALPLDEAGRKTVLAFLRAGGDRDRIGLELVDPEAEARYGGLLDILGDARNLALEELTERSTYRPWFVHAPLRQVVDSREFAPPTIDPIAANDGKYWWIFYQRQKVLRSLLVVRDTGREPGK